VELRQQNILDNIQDSTYMARTVYKEMDRDGDTKKDVIIQRRIYTKNHGKRYEEYLNIIINGKQLSKEEMEKESKDLKKNSKMSKTKMPLSKETRNDYEFKLIGSNIFNDMSV
jgi:hypothetical protein